MIFIKNKKMLRLFIVLLSITVAAVIGLNIVKADGNVPNFTVTHSDGTTAIKEISTNVGQVVELNYKVTPSSLTLTSGNLSGDIVLVIDTSYSNGNSDTAKGNTSATNGKITRIDATKQVANSLIDKFASSPNVKIGIATFATIANYDNNSIGLTNDSTALKAKINNIREGGSSNIGDGIRYGLNMLSSGSNSKKSIILLSEVDPNQYLIQSSSGSSIVYYTALTGNGTLAGTGWNDPQGYSMGYAKEMATRIKQSQYSSYMIDFSKNGKNKKNMVDIASNAGGSTYSAFVNNVFHPEVADTIFSNLSSEMNGGCVIDSVNLNFSLPSGLSYAGSSADVASNGTNYTLRIPNVVYKQSSGNTYTADPFNIIIKVKANKSGTYNNLQSGWTLTYNGINKQLITISNLPPIKLTVSPINYSFSLTKEVQGYSNQQTVDTILGDTKTLNYKSNSLTLSSSIPRKSKEVVLLIDSAYSNKANITNFLSKFTEISDVKFALIVYNSGATIYDYAGTETGYFVSPTNPDLINDINNIQVSTGSNLGEGLRKSNYILDDDLNTDKSVVIFGENNPNYYSYVNENTNYYTTIDGKSGSVDGGADKLTYANDSTKAADYAKQVEQIILGNTKLNILITCAGDGVNDEVIKDIAKNASTDFNKISTDSDLIQLKKIINSDLIISARVTEALPDGVKFSDGTNSLNKSVKLFYSYNSTSQKFDAVNTNIVSVNIVTSTTGQLNLNNSNLYYNNSEGVESFQSFNSLILNVTNTNSVKQGMFYKQNSQISTGENLGESYITNTSANQSALAVNSNVSMGALVNTSAASTTVVIKINSDNASAIQVSNITTKVYEVNSDNSLSEKTIVPTIQSSGNSYILTFTLNYDSYAVRRIIINYNYKVSKSGSITEDDFNSQYGETGIGVRNNCTVGSTNDNYDYSIVGMPDLF